MHFRYIAVEGPIGAGKTALTERLGARLDATVVLEDADNPFLADFYADLQNPAFETGIATFHRRYSTNTFPNWTLAQPFRRSFIE